MPLRVVPCRYEGQIVSWCPKGDEQLHVRQCAHNEGPDTCKRAEECARCPLYAPEAPMPTISPSPAPPPGWPIRFDERNLWPGAPGLRFNSSILADGDGCLFAYRTGWRGSDIWIGRLDAAFQPIGEPRQLHLRHREANYGREDVRLFRHKGRPHVSFIGVVGGKRIRHTNQLFARLSPDGMRVEDVFLPKFAGRRLWEKNWQFFDAGGHLYAIYYVNPHRVLRVASNVATLAYESPGLPDWQGGEPRGGAAPVLVGNEWWCFFHDRVNGPDGKLQYRTGIYTFDAEPPFLIRRYIPDPILEADPTTRPADQYASVVFPGGAVCQDGEWIVAHGVHDRWSELHCFDHATLDGRLVPVAPRAVAEPVNGDVLLGALLVGGRDEFESGGKVRGSPCTTASLTPAELSRYILPFAESCRRWQVQGVVLHDGLPPAVIDSHPWLRFSRVNPSGVNNFDRRWFAWRDWLAVNANIARVWLVDVNDVLFLDHPFRWLDRLSVGEIVANIEEQSYGRNPWFADHLPPLPAVYRDELLGRYRDRPALNCGAWSARRPTALSVCKAVCDELTEIEAHLLANPSERPVCRDMAAFGRVLLGRFASRLVTVPRIGDLLIHDRPRVEALNFAVPPHSYAPAERLEPAH